MTTDNNCPACEGQGWIKGLFGLGRTCLACLGYGKMNVVRVTFDEPLTLESGDTLSISFTLEIPA